MTRRLLALALLATSTGVLAVAQQPAAPAEGPHKERLIDTETPGVLLPLDATPVEPPVVDSQIDPSRLPDLPDVWETDPSTGARYRRGQLLVRFLANANATARAQAMQRSGASRISTSNLPENWELVATPTDTPLSDAAAALMQSGAAEYTSPNYQASAHQFRPNDENYSIQWNFDAIGMPYAWQINPGGANDVIVAVIDTGLNTVGGTFSFPRALIGPVSLRFAAVPDLVADGRIVSAFDFVYDDARPLDVQGHGTHVAGTIAQQTNNNIGLAGVAYNVRLMPLKALGSTWDTLLFPQNQGGSYSMVASAVRYAADNGAKVINMSLGGLGQGPIVRDAIRYAVDKGVFVAMSAGNEAEEGNPTTYPAAYASEISGAMAVGAVNRSLKRARYSTYKSYVEICAPGGEISVAGDVERGVGYVLKKHLQLPK